MASSSTRSQSLSPLVSPTGSHRRLSSMSGISVGNHNVLNHGHHANSALLKQSGSSPIASPATAITAEFAKTKESDLMLPSSRQTPALSLPPTPPLKFLKLGGVSEQKKVLEKVKEQVESLTSTTDKLLNNIKISDAEDSESIVSFDVSSDDEKDSSAHKNPDSSTNSPVKSDSPITDISNLQQSKIPLAAPKVMSTISTSTTSLNMIPTTKASATSTSSLTPPHKAATTSTSTLQKRLSEPSLKSAPPPPPPAPVLIISKKDATSSMSERMNAKKIEDEKIQAHHADEIKHYEDIIKNLKETVQQQQEKLQEYEKKMADANHIFSHQSIRRAEMERKMIDLEMQNQHLIHELKAARQQCDLAVNSASTVVSQIVSSIKAANPVPPSPHHTEQIQPVPQISKPCEVCPFLKEKVESLESKTENQSAHISTLQSKIVSLESESASLSPHLESLQSLTKSQSETIQTLTDASTQLETRIQETTAKLDRVMKTNAELTRVCHESESEKSKWRDETIRWKELAEETRGWVIEHQDMVEDYKGCLNTLGMSKILTIEGRLSDALKTRPLESKITALKLENTELKAQNMNTVQLERSYEKLETSYVNDIEKRDRIIKTGRDHLETTLTMAERFKVERDQALHTSQKTLKECAAIQEKMKLILNAKESELTLAIEASNDKVRSVRQAYEADVCRFKLDIEQLERSKAEIHNDLKTAIRERRALEEEIQDLREKMSIQTTHALRQLGIKVGLK